MRKSFWKKAAALLMTGALVMGTIPASVFAAGGEEDEDAPVVVQINKDRLKENGKANSAMSDATEGTDGPVEWAFDGDDSHWWHSNYGTPTDTNVAGEASEDHPIWIQTGFGETRKISGIIYQGRPEGQSGHIKKFEIYISNGEDEPNVMEDATAAQMTKVEIPTTEDGAEMELQNIGEPQTIMFKEPVEARWVRLVAKEIYPYTYNQGDQEVTQHYVAARDFSVLAEPKAGETLKLQVTEPAKKEYTMGENFDPTGLKVTGIYDNEEGNGTKDTIGDITDLVEISGYDRFTVSEAQDVKISYGGQEYTFTVKVNALAVENPAERVAGIIATPVKAELKLGDPTAKARVIAVYGDGSKQQIIGKDLNENVTFSPSLESITESIGEKEVTVTYTYTYTEGQEQKSDSCTDKFTINVAEQGEAPAKIEALAKIDKTKLKENAEASSSNTPSADTDTDGGADWAFDDNDAHWWHSDYTTTPAKGIVSEENPVWIQTGFGETRKVYGLLYMPRGVNGQNVTKDYEVWVSNETEKPDVNTAAEEANMKKVAEGQLQAINEIAQTIMLDTPTDAQWIRLVTKSVDVVPTSDYYENGEPDLHATAKFIDVLAAPKDGGTEATLDKVEVQDGYKKIYKKGEKIDRSSITVKATYTGEAPIKEAIDTEFKIGAYDTSEAGPKTVTLYSMGKELPIEITVVELQGIRVTAPTKTVYTQGDAALDTAGMTVTALYDAEGTITENVPLDAVEIDPESYDLNTPGKYNVKVSYTEGGVTKNTTFEITVEEKLIPPTLSLDKTELTLLKKTAKDTLEVTAAGENADKLTDWTWTSADPCVTVTADGTDPKKATVTSALLERQPKDVKVTVSAKFGEETVSAECTVKVDNWYADIPHDFWPEEGQEKLESSLKGVSDPGWMEGYLTTEYEDGKTRFGLNADLLRYQFALIVYRMAGSPQILVDVVSKFNDVTVETVPSAEARMAILWAQREGIINGYDPTTFGPNDKITRAQMMTMMYRYATKVKEITPDPSEFSDLSQFGSEVNEIQNDEMKEAIQWCVGKEIVGGVTEGSELKLRPQGSAKREQCAIVVAGFAKVFDEAE